MPVSPSSTYGLVGKKWAYVPQKISGSVVPEKLADGSTGDVITFKNPSPIAIHGKPQTQSCGGFFSPNKQAAYNILLSVGNNGNNDIALEMDDDGKASLRTNVHSSTPTTIGTSPSSVFTPGTWHHIVLTVDGSGNAKGYVDGVSVVTGVSASVPGVGERNGNVQFGCGTGDVQFEEFKVYGVSSYDKLLTAQEIRSLASGILSVC